MAMEPQLLRWISASSCQYTSETSHSLTSPAVHNTAAAYSPSSRVSVVVTQGAGRIPIC